MTHDQHIEDLLQDANQKLSAARARIAELEAVVGALDKTEDGKLVTPRMTLYKKSHKGNIAMYIVSTVACGGSPNDDEAVTVGGYYSTESAARGMPCPPPHQR